MDGLENILKLGGYLILFSMLAKLLLLLIGSLPLCSCVAVGLLEITNGIAMTAASLRSLRSAPPGCCHSFSFPSEVCPALPRPKACCWEPRFLFRTI